MYIELLVVDLHNKLMAVKMFNCGQSAGKTFDLNLISKESSETIREGRSKENLDDMI